MEYPIDIIYVSFEYGLVADKLETAAESEAEQAGGAATSMKYVKNPMKELSCG